MPILQNVLKSDTNKGDILGYNEQWSFGMEFYSKTSNCHSNLNLPSNHISSIKDMPNLLKIFKLSFKKIMKYYVPIYMQYFQF